MIRAEAAAKIAGSSGHSTGRFNAARGVEVGRQVLAQTFSAKDDEGNQYTIDMYVNMVDTSTLDGRSERPGLKEFRTRNGRRVNWRGKGEYEIVGHPMIPVTSDDPNAP